MADFRKFANLSLSGWDAKSLTQTIGVGASAHIGLWGGGPAGEDLDVKAVDPTVCVVHEEPRPTRWDHMRHFLLTALRDGETRVNAFLPGSSSSYAAPMTVKVVGRSGVRLIFFPGERTEGSALVGTIYVIGAGGESMKAAGGPAQGYADAGGHTAEPTPAGQYTLGPRIRVVAPSWPYSVIPYEAAVRQNAAGEAEYQDVSGRWVQATGERGTVTAAQMAFDRRSGLHPKLMDEVALVRNIFIDPNTGLVRGSIWKGNDFGRWGWNLRLNGQGTPYFVHTTPHDERASDQGKAIFLANSHGCIHLVPQERDRFMKAGYLKEGTPFEVRPYTEIGPP